MELEQLLDNIAIIKDTHPSIYNIWNIYLKTKIEHYKKINEQCIKMLEYVKNNDEPSPDLLLTLTILNIT
jgi:hypothetical protein